jgi:ABC-2 type transport system permease protein
MSGHQKPGKRSEFRRRGGSSWLVTVAEIVVAALIAGATGLAVAGLAVWSLIPLILAGAALLSLRRGEVQIARSAKSW